MFPSLVPTTMAIALFLVPSPTGYERATDQIPAQHWALVREVRVDPSLTHGRAFRDRPVIELPPHRTDDDDGILKHEVGHVVFNADPSLLEDWDRAFHTGRATREDAADSYKEYIDHAGSLEDRERERFLRERVFARRDTD